MPRNEFDKDTKKAAHDRAAGHCEECRQPFAGRRPEYDHILPDYLGGDNSLENCAVLCPKCHKLKTCEEDRPRIDKTRRLLEKGAGLRKSRHRWG
jgi:5-methylcytosine-specific restriction endonuclease McrA